MKRIRVAAGVVRNSLGQVLVGQRLVKDQYYQKWEFPGGKLEHGETPESALGRELNEELGIDVSSSIPLITIRHNYPDRKVALFVREVTDYQGVPSGAEGQAIKWMAPEKLGQLDFLEANQPIIRAAQLPAFMLITQTKQFGITVTLNKIDQLVVQEKRFVVQVRESGMISSELEKFIEQIKKRIVNSDVKLILNGDIKTARSLGMDGVHLKAALLSSLSIDEIKKYEAIQFESRQSPESFLVGASCHNQQEIEIANQFVDYAVLGSVLPTNSHPNGLVLGWELFQQLTDIARLPVYAIGGMVWQDEKLAREKGAQGVAMVSNVWS